jgi:RNA polymerase-binding transcription factor DksA
MCSLFKRCVQLLESTSTFGLSATGTRPLGIITGGSGELQFEITQYVYFASKPWEMTNRMTNRQLAKFEEILRAKQAELASSRRVLDSIAIERSADQLEEAQYKSARELAVANLNRESTLRHGVAMGLLRIQDGTFGTCALAGLDRARRKGKVFGRRRVNVDPARVTELRAAGKSFSEIASVLRVSRSVAYRAAVAS